MKNTDWRPLGKLVREGTYTERLYVDGLNFGKEFGFTEPSWSKTLSTANQRIKEFVDAMKKSKVEMIVFIDAWKGGEALTKWKERKEKDLSEEVRGVPQGIDIFMGEIFCEQRITVLYSKAENLDDCLAKWATDDKADILSGDKDYHRYQGKKYRHFGKFRIVKGVIQVQDHQCPPNLGPWKSLLKVKPEMTSLLATLHPSLVCLMQNHPHVYRCGVPSPLVRKCGNPHKKLGDLRAALYAHLKLEGPVTEEVVVWNEESGKPEWEISIVSPKANPDLLRKNPMVLLKQFFGDLQCPKGVDQIQWGKHLFACRAIVCELWLLGQPTSANKNSLLRIFFPPASTGK